MENIHTILEKYGITVDEERKADFEKEFAENYKTVAEHSKEHLRCHFCSWRAARDTGGYAALRARRPLLRSSTRLTLRG